MGLVQVYTGNGKGKTTAALGLCLRALGHGLKVCLIQFMKGARDCYGESLIAPSLEGLTVFQFGRAELVARDNPSPADFEEARAGLLEAQRQLKGRGCDLLILDEINVAVDFGLLGLNEVLSLIEEKPEDIELVLTGRNAPREIIEKAQLVTEMREIAHPFRKGVGARKGIDY
ncbi:MAG: cob(I)yrinic acid a,c-diamide adenosyltransferase [Candidatus Eremiobacteraeota bacterium]|nr:cob(I)yrinic acid a,c-diamide adenosyltransferase [Candidatus Eremiobacteraeota bacterium]